MTIRIPRRVVAVMTIGVATLAPIAVNLTDGTAKAEVAVLSQGSSGDDVRAVQKALVNAGFMSGGVDGIFGVGTAGAVKRFQRFHGLQATGEVDEATRIALGLSGSSTFGLSSGDRGEGVSRLQSQLKAAGYSPGAVDGIFGSATEYAVKKFQASLGYLETGEVNAATAAALEVRDGGGSSDSSKSSQQNSGDTSGAGYGGFRMSIGSSGDQVRSAQQLLIDLKYDVVGGADGYYGAMTANAMRAFQGDNGLHVDGIVGKNTAGMLEQARQGKVGDAKSTGSASSSSGNGSYEGLRTGSTGSGVKQLQQRLIDIGVPVAGGADGIYGPATARAVRLLQGWNGLEKTGAVGSRTAEVLQNAKKVDASDPQPSGDVGFAVYGERGARVTALQQKLVNAGVSLRGGVDGVFGGGTAAAVMSFQRSQGLSVTGTVSEATAKKLGLSKADKPAAAAKPTTGKGYIKVFPVQGWCGYANTWGDSRSGGRSHEGTDIIAAEGKLLYAVNDGVIEKIYSEGSDRLAGNGVRLRMADGTYAFYAHMAGLGPGIKVGTKVTAGQVVGTVGTTGNAYTPHLHFELHPKGGAAVNPYSYLKAVDACKVTTPR